MAWTVTVYRVNHVFWKHTFCFCLLQGLCSSFWPACLPTTETPVLHQLHCKRAFYIFDSHHLLLISSHFWVTASCFPPPLFFCFFSQIQHATVALKPWGLCVGSGRSGRCHHRGQRWWFVTLWERYWFSFLLPFVHFIRHKLESNYYRLLSWFWHNLSLVSPS